MKQGRLFVGRRKELAHLGIAHANKSHVLITGAAGIGKTALLQQALTQFPLLLCNETSSLGRICENFERQFGWSQRKMDVIERKNRLLLYLAHRAVPVALDSVTLTPPRVARSFTI
jgi:ABC-type molybdenum transport system ATPase subunit/photorepair protein PhrA